MAAYPYTSVSLKRSRIAALEQYFPMAPKAKILEIALAELEKKLGIEPKAEVVRAEETM